MHTYLLPLQQQFRLHQNPDRAVSAKAYMREQFDYFGMDAKTWRLLVKTHIKSNPLPNKKELTVIVKELFQLPQREYQYAAVELIAACKQQWDQQTIALIEYCLVHKSWWDTVDHAASELTGPYFKLFPQQVIPVTGKWNKSSNFWLQRSSIMFQKAYKSTTDVQLLAQYILHLATSKEFFIQKAIGWALREYSKTNPRWVQQFVDQHQLSPLSRREALKRVT